MNSPRRHRGHRGFGALHPALCSLCLCGEKIWWTALSSPAVLRRAEVGAEIEQIVLDARQHCIRIGIRRRTHMQPRQTDRGIGLVDRAERLDPERLLWHARAVAERGLARVAAPCVDAGE